MATNMAKIQEIGIDKNERINKKSMKRLDSCLKFMSFDSSVSLK